MDEYREDEYKESDYVNVPEVKEKRHRFAKGMICGIILTIVLISSM